MELTSPTLKVNQRVPEHFVFNGMGCSGDNVSPALEWKDAPSDTKSFALTVFDPDAPTDHGWWHWSVVNIPASVHSLPEGASHEKKLPTGAKEITTDFRQSEYGGPCPPKGDKPHRYIFTVYALKTENLDVNSEMMNDEVKNQIEKNCLEQASFTVTYGR